MSTPNITVEVEFNQSPEGGVPDTGTWTDISAYVRSGTINRGSNSYDGATGVYTAGTASVVLDNNDARFDPTYSSGPYWGSTGSVPAGYTGTQLLPGRKVRIRSTTDGGHYLWQGFVDSWNLNYAAGGKDATCTLVGTDAVKWIERQGDIGTQYDPSNPSSEPIHTAGYRIYNLLTLLGLDTTQVDVSDVSTALQLDVPSGSWWSYMQTVCTSGSGELYVDGQGRVVYRGRNVIMTDARSRSPQATFGDSGAELRYQNAVLLNDDVQLKNQITVTIVGGTKQAAGQGASLDAFSQYALDIAGLVLETDADAKNYAEWVSGLLSGVDGGNLSIFGSIHFDSITVDPAADPTNLNPQVLGRELGDRITIKMRPPGRTSDPISRDVYIRGIQHTFAPASWVTTWQLQDATRSNFLIFDDAARGKLDTNRFGPF